MSRPVPTTATGGAAAALRAPRWAAPSMPSARPESTTTPARASSEPSSWATDRPVGVQRRVPTMAAADAASWATSPLTKSTIGGSGSSANAGGHAGSAAVSTVTPRLRCASHRAPTSVARAAAAHSPATSERKPGHASATWRSRSIPPAITRCQASSAGHAASSARTRAGPILGRPARAASHAAGGRPSPASPSSVAGTERASPSVPPAALVGPGALVPPAASIPPAPLVPLTAPVPLAASVPPAPLVGLTPSPPTGRARSAG